jgi:succinate dehydrogenase/fumarate reductase flavoprotein subunit
MQKGIIEWPYPIRYDTVNKVDTDVLIIGGGIAGSWAAIKAAERGVKVTVVEQASALSAGPAGVDHWMYALDNPCCKISPDDFIEAHEYSNWGYINGIAHYVNYNEAYKRLLELEKMGAKVRDTEDEFKGAPFRDDETKLLFAYDYETKHTIRVWGQTFKPALYRELKRRNAQIYDRVRVTGLLNEDGRQGSRIVGAVGVNTRTGEFYVFKAKATVLCTGRAEGGARIWSYFGGHFFPTLRAPLSIGSGYAMAWKAGAELTLMEGRFVGGILRFPPYGTGNPQNTWYPCTIIDAKGREIPYVDKDGNILTSFEQRVRPSLLNQKFFAPLTGSREDNQYRAPCSLSERPEFERLVKKEEYTLPLYADLPGMPEHERRAIFGLMVANEGKTWIVYRNLTQAGFDPDKHLLQWYGEYAYSLDPMMRHGFSQGYGGVVIDWDFKTTLEGLYAAGDTLFADMYFHDMAATGGSWAGAKAAEYAKKAPEPRIDENQVENERKRVYASINRTEGIDWKELNTGISGIMRVYCGDCINEEMLNVALTWIKEIKEKEAQELVARNPHELMRNLEVLDILTFAEVWIYSALARKASSRALNFYRLDYPQVDPPEWHKFITIRQEDERIKIGELPLRYWLKPPYAPTYKENYEKHKPW